MFKKTHRFLLFLIALMVLLTPAVQAVAQPTDTSASWAAAEIDKWTSNGIFSGYPDGTFQPDRSVTRAEFAAIINKIFAFDVKANTTFTDVPAKAWYAKDLAGAVAADVLKGYGGKFRPNDPISRQEAALVLYKAFNLTTVNNAAADSFSDSKDIASWSRDAVCAMVENNFLKGQPGNIFAPKKSLTRAEFVKVIDNMLEDIKNKAGTYTGTVDGTLAVNTGAVTLKNMTVSGDLYITQGVGTGSVTLDNVTVKGRTVALGGGENSIVLNNTSLQGDLIIVKKNGKVRIYAQGSSEVSNTEFRSGGRLVEGNLTGHGFEGVEVLRAPAGTQIVLEGDYDSVLVDAPDVSVIITGGTVADMQVGPRGTGAQVTLAAGAVIDSFTADAAVTVDGQGTIKLATINADGTVFSKRPEKLKIGPNIIATIEGVILASLDETVPGGGAKNGGGGGNGGGGNGAYAVTVGNVIMAMKPGFGTASDTDISKNPYTDRVMGISFTTNVLASRLVLTEIQSPNTQKLGIDRTLTFTGSSIMITVQDLLGVLAGGNDSISIGSMRELFGEYVKITGTLYGTGAYASYTSYSATIMVKLGNTDPTPAQNQWVTVTYDEGAKTITAKINPGKENAIIAGIGITNIMMSTAGELPEQVKVGDGAWYDVLTQKTEIADAIAAIPEPDKAWSQVTLGDLAGSHIYFKKKQPGNGPVYTINIIN